MQDFANFDFDAGIKKLKSAETTYSKNLQLVAVFALLQAEQHGNWDYLQRVYDAVKVNATKAAVVRWAIDHSPTCKVGNRIKKDKSDAANDFNIEAAADVSILTYKQPPVATNMSVETLKADILRLVKKYEKAVEDDKIADDGSTEVITSVLPDLKAFEQRIAA